MHCYWKNKCNMSKHYDILIDIIPRIVHWYLKNKFKYAVKLSDNWYMYHTKNRTVYSKSTILHVNSMIFHICIIPGRGQFTGNFTYMVNMFQHLGFMIFEFWYMLPGRGQVTGKSNLHMFQHLCFMIFDICIIPRIVHCYWK